jgi:rubrerythrin
MTGIRSLPDLLSHALAIETEAVERYTMLADQMEVHNNPELVAIFRKLAHVEGLHAKEIEERAAGLDMPDLKPWEYEWGSGESPEASDPTEAHYLMTPHHALQMALAAEQRAFAFFNELVGKVEDAEVRQLAEEFAEEEREHVALVEELLERYPQPAADWDDDPDPPMLQE